MWKIVFQSFNLHFSYDECCQESFHMIENQLYFLFCKLSAHSSYHIPIFLMSCWVLLIICSSYFYINEINPLCYKLQNFPLDYLSFKAKGQGFLKLPHPYPSPCPTRLWALRARVYALSISMPSPPHRAWHCKAVFRGCLLSWAELNSWVPHPSCPPLWLGSSISSSSRKRWLFSLLTTAMHLFGLNWHLQPMEGQMYEITEDTASSWPVPTDVSLYPSGGTGLEIPDRKGKGATEGRVAVLFVSWVLCVCLWTEETFIMHVMCLTHSSVLWPFLHLSALHAGCQPTCVFISVPCHCELIRGLGSSHGAQWYPISCLEGSIMGFRTAGWLSWIVWDQDESLRGQ